MNREQLRSLVEEAVDAALARAAVAEVLRRYNARPVQTTAFFTGALLDIRYIMDAMRNLQGKGFSIRAVLTRSAGKIIGVDAVKDVLQSEEVYLEDQASNAVWDTSELILVPTLTVNTAAKVAHCISDAMVPDAISKSLMMGKLVVAALEGSCPDCKERMDKYKGKIPAAYAGALTQNLRTMQEFGVVFTSAKNFEARVCQIAMKRLRSLGEAAPQEAGRPEARARTIHGKRIVGLADLKDIRPGGRITVSGDSIVTQLAEDYARRQGIAIVRSKQ